MNTNYIPLVSVIIPTYGRADLLRRTIDSVLAQTYENIEIVVVNDNKLDSEHYQPTMIALQRYDNNPKVRVIADGVNVGGSLARNKGVEASQGDYISFLDDDDYYYENKISKQLEHLTSNEIDVSVCGMDIDRKGNIINKTNISKPRIGKLSDFLLNGNCYTPMIFSKREVLTSIGCFTNAPRFQDHILMLKILNNDFKVEIINENLFVHNDHSNLRISKNKINSYDVRWSIEKDLIFKLNKKEIKEYNFNKISARIAIYRDNYRKFKALKLALKNLFNINSVASLLKWFRSLMVLLIKK